MEISNTATIRKGGLASFNLFNYNINRFLVENLKRPLIYDIDNSCLTNVWSSGIRVDTGYE